MLNELSWGSYIAGTSTILICYYAGVTLTCYRKEILALLSQKKGERTDQDQQNLQDGSPNIEEANNFANLEETVSKIESILLKAGNQASKPELLGQLKEVLANYDGLRQPALKVAIFNYIVQNAEEICSTEISKQELDELVAKHQA